MYREMLEDDSLDNTTRKKFLHKMKRQSEKIDWILQSLFKMVNLEQGAVLSNRGNLLRLLVHRVREKVHC